MQVPDGKTVRQKDGQPLALDFIVTEGNAVKEALEDDIRADLAKVGINVNYIPLPKEEWNARATAGDFHMAFTETWGAPYDPHSYAASWRVPNEADFQAQQGKLYMTLDVHASVIWKHVMPQLGLVPHGLGRCWTET
jgi:nickel transport system substrate-binding protein